MSTHTQHLHGIRRILLLALGLVLLVSATAQASALVFNGDFENASGVGQIHTGYSTVSNWTVIDSATMGLYIGDRNADNYLGIPPNVQFYGPDNIPFPVNNGFTESPNGGFFLAGTAGSDTASISQVISGLTPGRTYSLDMYWAQAQMVIYPGDTNSGWNIGFGSDAATTGTPTLPNKGFSGWQAYNTTFTASAASQTLSFAPTGTGPGGYVLLDGVTLTQQQTAVPEPSTYALLCISLGVVGYARKRMNKKA